MEEKVESVSLEIPVQNETAPKAKSNKAPKYLLILILIGLIILGANTYLFYRNFTFQKAEKTVNTTTSNKVTATPTKEPFDEFHAVSFTTSQSGEIFLKYEGKFYQYDNKDLITGIKEFTGKVNSDSSWSPITMTPQELIEYKKTKNAYDEILSFKVFPNKKDFMIVMRWEMPEKTDKSVWDFEVFYYNDKTRTTSNVLSKTWPNDKELSVPLIGEISPDNGYVQFNMFGCWNCGGGKPETMLLNLKTAKTLSLGKTSYFKWLNNGAYEYKDFVVIECKEPMPGECSKDPSELPLKTGKL